MDIKAKLRPFYVAKMLYEQTDEDHYLTIAQIMEQLEKDYGISTSRGTVGDDIKALQELGVEIEVVPSTQKRFSLIGRRFDLPELKTLIDAVESARFIPKEKSAALVEKLGSLTSQHNTEKLVRWLKSLAPLQASIIRKSSFAMLMWRIASKPTTRRSTTSWRR